MSFEQSWETTYKRDSALETEVTGMKKTLRYGLESQHI
jgi:hypothetical protein